MRSLAFLLVLWSVPAAAGTVALAPSADATLIQNDEGVVADGTGPHLRAGRTNQKDSSIRRGTIRFDVAEAVPRGARLLDATLILHMSGGNPAQATLTLHRVTDDWGEGPAGFTGGQGAPAGPGDATWLHRFHNPAAPGESPAWQDAGGDFVSAESAAAIVEATGYYSWSAAGMLDDIRRWLNAPSSNAGWILQGDEGTGGSVKRLDSRENEDPTVRPLLIIEYGGAAR